MFSLFRKKKEIPSYIGTKKVIKNVKVLAEGSLEGLIDDFFNGASNHNQIKNVTQGKIYPVVKVEEFNRNCEDFTIIDDIGEEQTLCDFFFEEVS